MSKTHIFSHILTEAAKKGKNCIMVVRGRQLVEQASQRLRNEKVEHGVRMNKHWNKNYQAKIQICSVDTLIARNDRPKADLIVIDECHMAVSKGYKTLLADYPNAFILAVSATPYNKESLEHLADVIVKPIAVQDLIDLGFLVAPKYFAPSKPDLKGVHTKQGDYALDELEERMSGLTGDIVSHWKTIGDNRPTLCFAVNINHSVFITHQFNKAGIPAIHLEAADSFEQRAGAIEKLKRGEVKVISNCGVLGIGVDIPFASCIIMARPTKSYSLYVQQAGRGTRPFEGKENFIILDHAGNCLRHGFINDEPEVDLTGSEPKEKKLDIKTCEKCFVVFKGTDCPFCGEEVKTKERKPIEVLPGDLKELIKSPKEDTSIIDKEMDKFLDKLDEASKLNYYRSGIKTNPNSYWYKLKQEFGNKNANRAFSSYKKKYNIDW